MAITFNVTRERQRLMIPLLAVLFAVIILILYFGFFGVSSVPIPLPIGRKIPSVEAFNIDFNFFERDDVKSLNEAREPLEFPKIIGRDNPFLDYELIVSLLESSEESSEEESLEEIGGTESSTSP